MLCVSCIAASVTEILCHKAHVVHLVATMRLLRYKPLPDYDPTLSASRDTTPEVVQSYEAAYLRRWRKLADTTPSPVCKQWYKKAATDLLADEEGLDSTQPPKRTNMTPGLDTDDATEPAAPHNCNGSCNNGNGNDEQEAYMENYDHSASATGSEDDVEDEDDDTFCTPKSIYDQDRTKKNRAGLSGADNPPTTSN